MVFFFRVLFQLKSKCSENLNPRYILVASNEKLNLLLKQKNQIIVRQVSSFFFFFSFYLFGDFLLIEYEQVEAYSYTTCATKQVDHGSAKVAAIVTFMRYVKQNRKQKTSIFVVQSMVRIGCFESLC